MIVVDIDTKEIIDTIPGLYGHVYWSTPKGWAQHKLDMIVFKKAWEKIEDKYWYGETNISKQRG